MTIDSITFVSASTLAIAATTIGFGAVCLAVGIRGRRSDDHPLCRRCGFDLTGKSDATNRCGECGTDLLAPRAVRIGHRVRRKIPLAVGTAILLVWIAAAVTGLTVWSRGFVWQQHKPVWWLLREMQSPDAVVRRAAVTEISLRQYRHTLTPAQLDTVADDVLAAQADPSRPWSDETGRLIAAQNYDGTLSDARFHRSAELATPRLVLTVRPHVRRGDPLALRIDFEDRRIAVETLFFSASIAVTDRTVDGLPLPNEFYTGPTGRMVPWPASIPRFNDHVDRFASLVAILPKLADGPHTLHIKQPLHLDGFRHNPQRRVSAYDGIVDLTATFDLRPANEPGVVMRHDPAQQAAIEHALRVVSMTQTILSTAGAIDTEIATGPLPVGVAFSVSLSADGREWPLGHVAFPASTVEQRQRINAYFTDYPQTLTGGDVIFRPSTAAAVESVDVFEMWDGTATLHNVPFAQRVRPTAPATRRTTGLRRPPTAAP